MSDNGSGDEQPEKKKQRLGKFLLHPDFVRQEWDSFVKLMPRMIPVEVTYSFTANCMEITAYCAEFKACEEGEEPPMYSLFPVKDKLGKLLSIQFKAEDGTEENAGQGLIILPKGTAIQDEIDKSRNRQ